MYPFLFLVLCLAVVGISSACANSRYTAPVPIRNTPSATPMPEKGPQETLSLSGAEGGKAIFIAKACIGCHTIQGIPEAQGKVGPELTHQANNPLIAGVLPNTAQNLKKFLKEPSQLKPATLMPKQSLTDSEIEALVAFLRTLK